MSKLLDTYTITPDVGAADDKPGAEVDGDAPSVYQPYVFLSIDPVE